MRVTDELVVTEVGYDSAEATELVDELQADIAARYGGQDATHVEPAEFARPDGTFIVIRRRSHLVGCAGLRAHTVTSGPANEARDAELKRMYVRPSARRAGVASALLTEIESRARGLGYRRLVLETGTAQPEAIALYEAHGYRPIPGFGHYAGYPSSRCFGKQL